MLKVTYWYLKLQWAIENIEWPLKQLILKTNVLIIFIRKIKKKNLMNNSNKIIVPLKRKINIYIIFHEVKWENGEGGSRETRNEDD